MDIKIDDLNIKYGNWTVLADLGIRGKKWRHYVLAKCKCGKEKEIILDGLKSGRSCQCRSCASMTSNLIHGMSSSVEYETWINMNQRCYNTHNKKYKNYGGRGIKVCDSWLNFQNFYEDMGPRPGPEYSIDRINNNGNYEHSNCRWTIMKVQANNRRAIIQDDLTNRQDLTNLQKYRIRQRRSAA